jgi:hypothetical protein
LQEPSCYTSSSSHQAIASTPSAPRHHVIHGVSPCHFTLVAILFQPGFQSTRCKVPLARANVNKKHDASITNMTLSVTGACPSEMRCHLATKMRLWHDVFKQGRICQCCFVCCNSQTHDRRATLLL